METLIVAKKKAEEGSPAKKTAEPQTNVKCYQRLAKKITQLANLLGCNQADVISMYEKQINEELLTAMARKAAEIKREE